jgi:hypothetical protein
MKESTLRLLLITVLLIVAVAAVSLNVGNNYYDTIRSDGNIHRITSDYSVTLPDVP